MRQRLSQREVDGLRPVRGEGGRCLRAYCPFHGGDRQRSLRIDLASGRFQCFACEAWGYLEEGGANIPAANWRRLAERAAQQAPIAAVRDLAGISARYRLALPAAAPYLESRGVPMEVAERFGLGYAARGEWAHPSRDWRDGRVVFPHTAPDGTVVNLYGRAANAGAPREWRHDHLPGSKGYFNGRALREGDGPLYVCEGPFDALSLACAGAERVVAIFGVRGWRWDWWRESAVVSRELVLALDADAAGSAAWRELARQARLRGVRVRVMECYGDGCKDANEAWLSGQLTIQPGSRVNRQSA